MFVHLKDLEGLRISAEDGEIGHVADVYVDDHQWVVRYLVVATGSWLFGKKVLISPNAVTKLDRSGGAICVALSKEQVRNSPDIDTDRPISRQQEAEYHLYYNFPPYWGGVALWGRYEQPGVEPDETDEEATHQDKKYGAKWDSHLRSAREVRGYRVTATDGEVGHIDNFLMESDTWAIRYLVINTGGWLKRHEVLFIPKLIDRVSWADARVTVNTSKGLLERAPEYHAGHEIDRTSEMALFSHFTAHPYWEESQQ
ncbi:MAG: PRC-barrel domain-containing protein [Spirochaetales bacterium]